MVSHKLIVIGLDAADFQLAQRFMAEGLMPRLSAIGERGCFSRLRSTIPPQTAPAWTSMTTGVNPGRHGIYYFYNFSTSPITIVNATNTTTPRIWDYVTAAKEKSVIINVPVTYPAREVSGYMVAGIPPWYFDERSVYPATLMGKLREAGYEIDTPLSRGLEKDPPLLVEKLVATEGRRVGLFLDLLNEGDWTFGMIVLTALDRLQHKMVGKGAAEDEAVRMGYREVDGLVGKIVDALGQEVNYLVASDHGFNPRPLAFYPNSWLYKQGLLKRKSSLPNRLTRIAHDAFDGHLLWMPQRVTRRFQGAATEVHTIDAVDLERSRAYLPGTDGVIVVKSPEDRKKVVSGLSEVRDDTGKEVCKVYTRDQIYEGDRVQAAPDLLIVPRDDINIKTDPFSSSFVSSSGDFPKGNHSSNGIFLAQGPGIKRTENLEVSIEDVTPTSLALMGMKPPSSMDGRALEEVLAGPRPMRPVELGEVANPDNDYAFSEKEEKQVMDNLRRLGYT